MHAGRPALGAIALVTALSGVACDKPLACGDQVAVSDQPEAPRIVEVSLPTQLAQDPWTLVLALTFHDANADLSGGSVVFYLGSEGESAATQALLPAFKLSALDEGSVDGTLTVPLRFDDDVEDGTDVDLGLQLVDGASLRSNCYGLSLAFEVNRL
ncbi:MAG: hypothetical protein ACAI38_15555 [Myxococcota bacterium]|nr:hypothetical protein [Myxococcota bacterium]